MDSGEVIPSLNEPWTMAGAKVSEWMSGFVMVIIAQEMFFSNPSRAMPALLIIWIVTTFTLAGMRRGFPDEERGLANKCLTSIGIQPPNIPAPALIQPLWSGCPLKGLDDESEYMFLELDNLFDFEEDEED
jgi:hypothetical protein